MEFRLSRRPGLLLATTALRTSPMPLSTDLNSASMPTKRSASSGSSRRTSSEPMKSVSRYAQRRCTSDIIVRTSLTLESSRCHRATSS